MIAAIIRAQKVMNIAINISKNFTNSFYTENTIKQQDKEKAHESDYKKRL